MAKKSAKKSVKKAAKKAAKKTARKSAAKPAKKKSARKPNAAFMKTHLDTHQVSFSLSHSQHSQTGHRRTARVSDNRPGTVEQLVEGVAANDSATRGVAQQTWVHDHDVLELRYVN